MAEETKAPKKFRRVLLGKVVKASGKNTISVRVESKHRHPKYGKIIKSFKKYAVHVEDETQYVPGTKIEIEERSPVSSRKTWSVKNIIK